VDYMLWFVMAVLTIIWVVMAAISRHLWILFGGATVFLFAESLRVWGEDGCMKVVITLGTMSGLFLVFALIFFRKSYRLAKEEDRVTRESNARDAERFRRETMSHTEPTPTFSDPPRSSENGRGKP